MQHGSRVSHTSIPQGWVHTQVRLSNNDEVTLPPNFPVAVPGFLELLLGLPGFLGAGTLNAGWADEGLFPSTDSSSSKLLSGETKQWLKLKNISIVEP